MTHIIVGKHLTLQDQVVLQSLADDIQHRADLACTAGGRIEQPQDATLPKFVELPPTPEATEYDLPVDGGRSARDVRDLAALEGLNDPTSTSFEPTVFSSLDLRNLKLHPVLDRLLLQPYIRWAQTIVRHPADVVMLNHLFLYASTSIPSAIYLYHNFTYIHGILHLLMQITFIGPYTILIHQHTHQRGILAKRFPLDIIDRLFPYIFHPFMGHTWNSFYYHHLKHHHVEGNGPDDLSSTIRYQRDDVWHILHYVGRFTLFASIELPLYFIRKGQTYNGLGNAFCELVCFTLLGLLFRMDWRPTLFAFFLPLITLRAGMMMANYAQHAFIDLDQPESDYKSSLTIIDVSSNRYCYNDGYHTSHHLNPLRHWRDHPTSFLRQKATYAKEGTLVFHNIDFVMITVRLMMKDYETLAKCVVPIGEQVNMTMDERIELLKRRTRRFSEEEIEQKFGKTKSR